MKTSNCQTSPWTRPADRLLRGWLRVAMFVAWCLSISRAVAESPPRQPINYNRDVRPILADNCFRCHGPDEGERQSGLRLDSFEGATAEGDSGLPAIIPGNVEESELLRRIDADEYEVMPPPDSGKTLSEQQKEVLREWIAQGAEFAPHWSFIAPKLPALPELADSSWPRNAIDHFVLQGLRSAGVAPAEEADRRTLIRRVSFDLTGIPPTPQEVEAFLSDESTNAYERLVDRLLASPRFGERMAIDWLDLARYADTDGYEKDSHRQMWPYRDWVIRAFNRNMPFDQFTIEQLAGDMLPNATRDQQIASAFNRNGPTTSESGSDPAEYAVKYAVDRVATTSTVWLGLTMQCAECHDHKFDPLSIRDFYSMVAFFDQVPEIPLYEGADSPPSIPALDPQQEAAVTKLDARLAKLGAKLKLREQSLLGEQLAWESQRREAARGLDAPRTGLIAEYLLDEEVTDIAADSSGRQRHGRLVVNDASSASRPQSIAAVSGRCVEFYGYGGIESGALPEIDLQHGFSYGAWVRPTAQGGVVLSCVDPQSSGRGFDLYLQAGQALVHVVDHWPAAAVKVTSQTNYKPDEWLHVMVVVRGGGGAKDVALYFDGVEQPTTADLDAHPLATVNGAALLRIGSRANSESPMHGAVDDVRVYDRPLEPSEVLLVAHELLEELVRLPGGERTDEQQAAVDRFYRRVVVAPETAELRGKIAALEAERSDAVSSAPMVRVMADVPERRPTFVLMRGDYRSPGDQVAPAVPAALGALPPDRPANRLELARWLVGTDNPLTARVMINRLWTMCFGVGLVKTVDDFGSQGEWPSHPELLDWLAATFRDQGWDVKAMLRLIVTSAAYRQASHCPPEKLDLDPENRLIGRGPRQRLPAEMIRDNALAVAGLLHEQLGGPSVFPYHPPGLWEEMAWADAPHKTWLQDRGPNLYRRGLYTFWKRSLVHPAFSLFDAPTRNVCAYARPTTNTPLQAFVTLNETSFIEAARGLAGRTIAECGGPPDERITQMYRTALARLPHDQELSALRSLFATAQDAFQRRPQDAEAFTSVGELSRPQDVDVVDYAAWTVVAQAVLNLDETMTKE